MWKVEKPFGVIEIEVVEYDNLPTGLKRRFADLRKLATAKLTLKTPDGKEIVDYADGIYYNPEIGWYAYIDSSEILKFLKGKKDHVKILIDTEKEGGIGEEIKQAIKQAEEKVRARFEEEFRKALRNVKEIYIGIGGDTLLTYVSIPVPYDLAKLSGNLETLEKLEDKFRRAIDLVIRESRTKEEWMKKLGVEKTNIRTGLYNILYDDGTWGKISLDNHALNEAIRRIEEQERRAKKKAEEEKKAFEEKKKQALEEAKRTGKEVVIAKIGGYDGDDPMEVRFHGTQDIIEAFERGEGLGWVDIYLVATPDGKIIEKHVPNY